MALRAGGPLCRSLCGVESVCRLGKFVFLVCLTTTSDISDMSLHRAITTRPDVQPYAICSKIALHALAMSTLSDMVALESCLVV